MAPMLCFDETLEKAMKRKKRARRGQLRSFVASKSSLSFSQMTATSATAVTMALISSQLTSLVNSLLLAGLASIGTALVSEFYKLLVEGAKQGARRIVPIESGEAAVDEQEDEAVQPETDGEELKPDRRPRNKFAAVLRLPQIQMALVFAVMAVATIFANYQIAEHNDSAAVVESARVYHTTEEKPETIVSDDGQGLTKEERESIIEELKKELEATEGAEVLPSAPPEDATAPPPSDAPAPPPAEAGDDADSASSSDVEALRERIEQLEREKGELETKVDELSKPSDTSSDSNDELLREIEALRERVKELEDEAIKAEAGAVESQSHESPEPSAASDEDA